MSSLAKARTRAITTDPVGKVMFRLTMPMVYSIISLMAVGVVDAWFIGRLGIMELAALGFALPVIAAVSSVALGLGMGISTLVSRALGESDFARATALITDSRMLVLVVGVFLGWGLWLFQDLLFTALGATSRELSVIHEFMDVWILSVPIGLLYIVSGSALRGAGNQVYSAYLNVVLAAVNIVLDPLLIFGFGDFQGMGMAGAAYATVLAFFISYLLGFYFLAHKERLLVFSFGGWSRLRETCREVATIGVPAVFANLMTPVGAALMTALVAGFRATAVAGYGVASRIESISLVLIFALSGTLPMFIGQNIGAGKPERAWAALRGSLIFGLVLQAFVYVVLALGAAVIAGSFSDNTEVRGVLKYFLWIVPLTYGFHGVVILVMVSLNVIKRPKTALVITFIRLICLNVPLAWLGGQIFDLAGLFAGFAMGNIFSAVAAWVLIRRAWVAEVEQTAP